MKKPDQINEWYLARLKEALDHFAGGSADKFARYLDWPQGGGMVRQIRLRKRPMQESILSRCRLHSNPELAHWFDLPPDLAAMTGPVDAPQGEDMLSNEVTAKLKFADELTRWQAENAVRVVLGLDPLPRASGKRSAA